MKCRWRQGRRTRVKGILRIRGSRTMRRRMRRIRRKRRKTTRGANIERERHKAGYPT